MFNTKFLTFVFNIHFLFTTRAKYLYCVISNIFLRETVLKFFNKIKQLKLKETAFSERLILIIIKICNLSSVLVFENFFYLKTTKLLNLLFFLNLEISKFTLLLIKSKIKIKLFQRLNKLLTDYDIIKQACKKVSIQTKVKTKTM